MGIMTVLSRRVGDVHDAIEHLRLDVAEQPFFLGVPQDRPDVMDLAGHHDSLGRNGRADQAGEEPRDQSAAAARSRTTSEP